MKIVFSCIHFPIIMAVSPQKNEKKTPVFYTSKLYGLTDMN